MTRDEAKKLLPIIQAFAEGKNVQVKSIDGVWRSARAFNFDMSASNYRIAPDPLEQAMEIYNNIKYETTKEGLDAVLKAIKDGTIVL